MVPATAIGVVGVEDNMTAPPEHIGASPAARRSIALIGTLIARSFGLAAGVALALLGATLFWVP
jgi:hypothetical protein